jgi:transposase InsO family protein
VERLMREHGLEGVRRGTKRRTTITDASAPRPPDLVNRRFVADRPDQLWPTRPATTGAGSTIFTTLVPTPFTPSLRAPATETSAAARMIRSFVDSNNKTRGGGFADEYLSRY